MSGTSWERHVLAKWPRVSVVLPTMNEERNVERLCRKLSDLK